MISEKEHKEFFPEHLPISIHDDLALDSHWFEGVAYLTYDDMRSMLDIMQSWMDGTKNDIIRKIMQIDCVDIFQKDIKFCHSFCKKLTQVLAEINMNSRPRYNKKVFEKI